MSSKANVPGNAIQNNENIRALDANDKIMFPWTRFEKLYPILEKIRIENDIEAIVYCINKDMYYDPSEKDLDLFYVASKNNNFELVRFMIEYGANYERSMRLKYKFFNRLCLNGNTEAVRYCLKLPKINVNAIDQLGFTGLYHAAINNNYSTVNLLVSEKDLNINQKVKDGDNVLISVASKIQDINVFKLLLQNIDIDLNEKGRNGENVVMRALENDNLYLELTELLLLTRKIDINAKNDLWQTVLIKAVLLHRNRAINCILSYPGINLNLWEKNYKTALMLAVSRKDNDIVKSILAVPGVELGKAMKEAVLHRNFEALQLILAVPDVNINGDMLKEAVRGKFIDNRIEYVKCLISAPGFDANLIKMDMIKHAIIYDDSEIALMLLKEAPFRINDIDECCWTLLMYASRHNRVEVVKFIINTPGININTVAKDKRTALMIASARGNIEIVKLLLEVPGIDKNARNLYGWTALSYAILYMQPEVAKLLTESGVELAPIFPGSDEEETKPVEVKNEKTKPVDAKNEKSKPKKGKKR